MSKRERAKRDSVFSWNDQSANIRTVTWETGGKLNIKMYQKKLKKAYTEVVMRNRAKSWEKSSQYVRQLRYSFDMDAAPENMQREEKDEEQRKIIREVKLASKWYFCVSTKAKKFQNVFSPARRARQYFSIAIIAVQAKKLCGRNNLARNRQKLPDFVCLKICTLDTTTCSLYTYSILLVCALQNQY